MEDSEVVKKLEWGGDKVVKGDWRKHISIELQNGECCIYHFLNNNCVGSIVVLSFNLLQRIDELLVTG